MEDKRLFNTDELASMLGVHSKTILLWVSEDRIPYMRLGPKTLRFEPERVLEALRKETQSQPGD